MKKLICPICNKMVDSFYIDYREAQYCSVLYHDGYIDWDSKDIDDTYIELITLRCSNCFMSFSDEYYNIEEAKKSIKDFEIELDANNNIVKIGESAKIILHKLARKNNIEITNDEELNNFFKMYYNL